MISGYVANERMNTGKTLRQRRRLDQAHDGRGRGGIRVPRSDLSSSSITVDSGRAMRERCQVAVIFELVINFGDDRRAAERAVDTVVATQPIPVGTHLIGLHPPRFYNTISYTGAPYIEFAAIPAGVGWGLPDDRDAERVELDKAQLSALGHGLYDVLSRMDGYLAAMVGWDPESFIDLDELRLDSSDELAQGDVPGLVLSSQARQTLSPTAGFQPFANGFEWIPYRGERSGNYP